MNIDSISSDFLVFIVGISGSGKDTLIREVARFLKVEKSIPVKILRRVITRPSDESEDSISITPEEFLKRKEENEFVLSWSIYGNWYGCPRKSIENPLKDGELVLANVSRTILHEARKYYPQSKIVFIDVPQAIARQRVKSRGREAGKRLKDRLARIRKRDIDMPSANITIANNGTVEKAINELSNYLVTIYYATSTKGRTGDPSND